MKPKPKKSRVEFDIRRERKIITDAVMKHIERIVPPVEDLENDDQVEIVFSFPDSPSALGRITDAVTTFLHRQSAGSERLLIKPELVAVKGFDLEAVMNEYRDIEESNQSLEGALNGYSTRAAQAEKARDEAVLKSARLTAKQEKLMGFARQVMSALIDSRQAAPSLALTTAFIAEFAAIVDDKATPAEITPAEYGPPL